MSGKATIIWETQDGRNAVVTVGFACGFFQVITYDQGGVSFFTQYSIHDNPIQFLKLMVRMSFGDNVAIRYCPSITPESGNPSVTCPCKPH